LPAFHGGVFAHRGGEIGGARAAATDIAPSGARVPRRDFHDAFFTRRAASISPMCCIIRTADCSSASGLAFVLTRYIGRAAMHSLEHRPASRYSPPPPHPTPPTEPGGEVETCRRTDLEQEDVELDSDRSPLHARLSTIGRRACNVRILLRMCGTLKNKTRPIILHDVGLVHAVTGVGIGCERI